MFDTTTLVKARILRDRGRVPVRDLRVSAPGHWTPRRSRPRFLRACHRHRARADPNEVTPCAVDGERAFPADPECELATVGRPCRGSAHPEAAGYRPSIGRDELQSVRASDVG